MSRRRVTVRRKHVHYQGEILRMVRDGDGCLIGKVQLAVRRDLYPLSSYGYMEGAIHTEEVKDLS